VKAAGSFSSDYERSRVFARGDRELVLSRPDDVIPILETKPSPAPTTRRRACCRRPLSRWTIVGENRNSVPARGGTIPVGYENRRVLSALVKQGVEMIALSFGPVGPRPVRMRCESETTDGSSSRC